MGVARRSHHALQLLASYWLLAAATSYASASSSITRAQQLDHVHDTTVDDTYIIYDDDDPQLAAA